MQPPVGGPGYAPPFPPGWGGPPPSREQELELLQQQAGYFAKALEELQARIRELEGDTGEE